MGRVVRAGLILSVIVVAALLVPRLVGSAAPAPVQDRPAEVEPPTVLVSETTEIPGRVRDAEVPGGPVRVRLTPESAGGESPQEFWRRSLSEPEKAQALRMVATIRKTTDTMFDLSTGDLVEDEVKLANLLKTRAMCDVVIPRIEAGEGFFVEGMPAVLKSNSEWHYWNMHMRTKNEGDVVLCVPIDLAKHPDVRHCRERAIAMRAFKRSEDARRWNTLSREVRRSLLDAAEASRAAFDQLEQERESLPSDESSAARHAEIGRLMREHLQVVAKVPPYVNPVTLDWGPR